MKMHPPGRAAQSAIPRQGVIDESSNMASTDLAISMACLTTARRDMDAALRNVDGALRGIRAKLAGQRGGASEAERAAWARVDSSCSTAAPAPKRPVVTLALLHAACAPGEAPAASDAAQLPVFVDAALEALEQMREQASCEVMQATLSRLNLAALAAQMCVAKLQLAAASESERHGARITQLPAELAMQILAALPADALSCATSTCHVMRGWGLELLASRTTIATADVRLAARAPACATRFEDAMRPRAPERQWAAKVLGWLAPRCPNLQALRLTRAPELRDRAIVELVAHARGVRDIDVSHCVGLTDVSVSAVAACCPNLRALNVRGCPLVSNGALATLATRCPLLVSLCLSGTSAGDKALQAISLHCPLLERLDVSRCVGVSELGIQPIVRRCVRLEVLDLSHCDGINDLFLGLNGLACTQLRELALRSCQGVMDTAIMLVALHCKGLRSLDLSMCVHLTECSMRALGLHCRRIERLCLDSCVRLTAASIAQLAEHLGSELISLSMRSVSTITDEAIVAIGVHCTGLRSLDVANCPLVGDQGLTSVGFSCERLVSLNAESCERVTDASIIELCYGCVHLRHLNVQWCPRVTDDSLEVISEMCPELESLWLTGTDGGVTDGGVVELARRCTRLKTLCVRDCPTLTDSTVCTIANSCKHLEQLDVHGCAKISDASILVAMMKCAQLRAVNIEGCWRVSGLMLQVVRKKNPGLLIVAEPSNVPRAGAALEAHNASPPWAGVGYDNASHSHTTADAHGDGDGDFFSADNA